MKMLTFASRNAKEILRDPLNLAFGLGFPVILLLLLSAIQANVPVPLFEISHLSPAISVFALSFITLFSATIISKDRNSALLQRLYTTPLRPFDFIVGYTLPLLPIAILQGIVCYITAIFLGLEFSVTVIYALLLNVPVSLFFIGLGLLCGSVFSDKQVGGICGAVLTNLCAWLSGAWFDLELIGGTFERIANLLPFVHAVEMGRAILGGNFSEIFTHLWWVLSYALIAIAAAIALFLRQMNQQ